MQKSTNECKIRAHVARVCIQYLICCSDDVMCNNNICSSCTDFVLYRTTIAKPRFPTLSSCFLCHSIMYAEY